MNEDLRKQRLQRTTTRAKYLESLGYKVETMWECEYRKIRACEPDCAKYSILPDYTQSQSGKVSQSQLLTDVQNERFFGMLEVDISVPDEWAPGYEKEVSPYEYFQEMAPLFCTTDVNMSEIGDHMLQHVQNFNLSNNKRRLLVGGLKASRILLASPLLKWYLDEGLIVTRIYQTIEFNSKSCFSTFAEEVSDARRLGDVRENMQAFGETMKLIGNSAYGSLIMNKEQHNNILYTEDPEHARCLAGDNKFRKMSELEDMYEVEMEPTTINMNLPIYLGFFILQYAKKRMLEFSYQFLKKNLEQNTYMYLSMDTDSAYYALSTPDLQSAIKSPELLKQYVDKIHHNCNNQPYSASTENWFPRKCCDKHIKYDRRTPGLFKLEAVGHSMISLCSKTYVLQSQDNSFKLSCKGLNKKFVSAPYSTFSDVLTDQVKRGSVNRGIRMKGTDLHTYKQHRSGISYFYCKRKVLEDGVSTLPLDITLCPWNLPARFLYTRDDVLGNDYECEILYDNDMFTSVTEAYCFIMHEFGGIEHGVEIRDETELGSDWLLQRDSIMQELLQIKVMHNEEVAPVLFGTGNLPLVYTHSDKYWSVNITYRLATVTDKYCGMNRLSVLWERLRSG